MSRERAARTFSELLALTERLRSKEGCPWDREQTHASLKTYLLEEVYEVLEAIDTGDQAALREELGDLLFQIIFHCEIAAQAGDFRIEDVLSQTLTKMKERHPHVFGEETAKNPEEVIGHWMRIKAKEGKGKRSVLDGIPRHLPALARAWAVQKRATQVGFDWENIQGARDKLEEEWKELEKARREASPEQVKEEMGDLLFALVNVARFLGVHPEDALQQGVKKFAQRFQALEKDLAREGRKPGKVSLEEMNAIWDAQKAREGRNDGRRAEKKEKSRD